MTICRVMESKKGLVQVQILDNGQLCWSQLQLSDKSIYLSTDVQSVPAKDILHVKVRPVKKKKPWGAMDAGPPGSVDVNVTVLQRTHRLLVHYVCQTDSEKLRMNSRYFDGTLAECESLARDLSRLREAPGEERRKMLVLVNPVSGHGKAVRIFRSRVEPLFKACDINVDLIVSSKRGDLTRAVKIQNLQEYDGIVVFGGDGSVSEVVNGLLLRGVEEAGRDINDAQCQLVPATIPIGVIPTGTGNWLCSHLHGTNDVITGAIHVIRGKSIDLNAVTLHEPNRFLHISFLIQHLGFVGDMIHRVELNRWMGPARYTVFSPTTILNRRLMSVDLACQRSTRNSDLGRNSSTTNQLPVTDTASTPQTLTKGSSSSDNIPRPDREQYPTENTDSPIYRCANTCSNTRDCKEDNNEARTYLTTVCSTAGLDDHQFSGGQTPSGRSVISGSPDRSTRCSFVDAPRSVRASYLQDHSAEHIQADMYNICLSVTRTLTEDGTMKASLGQDTMSLMMVKKCSLPDFVKHFVKVRDNTPGMDNFSFVESRDVTALTLTMTTPESRQQCWYINSDGESLSLTSGTCYFKLHPRVFRAFGMSIQSSG